jgi:membrane-bound lytic murein transglycosylase A
MNPASLSALSRSCGRILKQDPARPFFAKSPPETAKLWGSYGDWQVICRDLAARSASLDNPAAVRAFYQQWFTPYAASSNSFFGKGLFTGYYEASLRGSSTRTERYRFPLYKRPKDLIDIDLGQFRDAWKGEKTAGRIDGAKMVPYYDRDGIDSGALANKGLELVWVDDPIDVFFLHIQGSGRVQMADGSVLHVGYDGQNGHMYYAVGRELVAKNILTKEQVSMQAIRDWMRENPDQARQLRAMNKSYVFFKELPVEGAIGGEGVALTPMHSLAVDYRLIPYGVPLWLDAAHPIYEKKRLRSLMIAQDTGGAIRGPVRGDVFFGHGPDAEIMAGRMKSAGDYWLLLPKKNRP